MRVISLKTWLMRLRCDCPEGYTPILEVGNECVCWAPDDEEEDDSNEDEPASDSDDAGDYTVMVESVKASLPEHPIEFSIAEFDDTVTLRLSKDGIAIRIGRTNYIPIPVEEHARLWEVIASKLSALEN